MYRLIQVGLLTALLVFVAQDAMAASLENAAGAKESDFSKMSPETMFKLYANMMSYFKQQATAKKSDDEKTKPEIKTEKPTEAPEVETTLEPEETTTAEMGRFFYYVCLSWYS